jgi:hypothetical protein
MTHRPHAENEWATTEALRHKDVWGRGCMAPHILHLVTGQRLVVSFTLRSSYTRENEPTVSYGWVGSRTGVHIDKGKMFVLAGHEHRSLGRVALTNRHNDRTIPDRAYSPIVHFACNRALTAHRKYFAKQRQSTTADNVWRCAKQTTTAVAHRT